MAEGTAKGCVGTDANCGVSQLGPVTRNRAAHRGPVGRSHVLVLPMPRLKVKVLVMDMGRVRALLRWVAIAKAEERRTRLVWQEYTGSRVIDVLYKLTPGAKPGTVEVVSPSHAQLTAEAEEEVERLLSVFLDKVELGPAPAVRFLQAQEDIARGCNRSVQAVYREATQLNSEIAVMAQRAVARFTVIRTASTVIVKSLAIPAGKQNAWGAFGIGFGYDLALTYIDNWDEAEDAQAIALKDESLKNVGQEVVEEAADGLEEIYTKEGSMPAHRLDWLGKRMAAMEQEVKALLQRARLGSPHQRAAAAAKAKRLMAKLAKDARRLSVAKSAVSNAAKASAFFGSIKWVFLASDVYDAVGKASSISKEVGYEGFGDAVGDAF